MDRLNIQVSDELPHMMRHFDGMNADFTYAVNLILIARYDKRVDDHACNIAERVFFMITGNRITPSLHGRPAGN